MTFYNTIQENPSELARSQTKAKTQEQKIINCFKQYERPLSPSMVLSISGLNCPITSIRRAMTNLSDDGKLEKTKQAIFDNGYDFAVATGQKKRWAKIRGDK